MFCTLVRCSVLLPSNRLPRRTSAHRAGRYVCTPGDSSVQQWCGRLGVPRYAHPNSYSYYCSLVLLQNRRMNPRYELLTVVAGYQVDVIEVRPSFQFRSLAANKFALGAAHSISKQSVQTEVCATMIQLPELTSLRHNRGKSDQMNGLGSGLARTCSFLQRLYVPEHWLLATNALVKDPLNSDRLLACARCEKSRRHLSLKNFVAVAEAAAAVVCMLVLLPTR
jgi:hypothetical protein